MSAHRASKEYILAAASSIGPNPGQEWADLVQNLRAKIKQLKDDNATLKEENEGLLARIKELEEQLRDIKGKARVSFNPDDPSRPLFDTAMEIDDPYDDQPDARFDIAPYRDDTEQETAQEGEQGQGRKTSNEAQTEQDEEEERRRGALAERGSGLQKFHAFRRGLKNKLKLHRTYYHNIPQGWSIRLFDGTKYLDFDDTLATAQGKELMRLYEREVFVKTDAPKMRALTRYLTNEILWNRVCLHRMVVAKKESKGSSWHQDDTRYACTFCSKPRNPSDSRACIRAESDPDGTMWLTIFAVHPEMREEGVSPSDLKFWVA